MAMSCDVGPGNQSWSSGRAASICNHWVTSTVGLALVFNQFIEYENLEHTLINYQNIAHSYLVPFCLNKFEFLFIGILKFNDVFKMGRGVGFAALLSTGYIYIYTKT